MHYWAPDAYDIGDLTIIRAGDTYHLFSETFRRGWTGGGGHRPVIHYVSHDLVNWQELPIAIDCGTQGAFDWFAIFHMDVFIHAGTWYMHYTGLDKRGPGQQQAVGLATSPDGITWTKHPANPVARADLRWYEPAIPRQATYQEKDFGRLWYRDPCIIANPEPSGKDAFGMIVVARDAAQHPDVRGCIAWATSTDLIQWTQHPPIFSPGRFHTIETPSIFEHAGRHYLIYMTHPAWGVNPLTTDPCQNAGNFYTVSESGWTGPYVTPRDEVLVAAHEDLRFGAQRTVDTPDGDRLLYGWLSTRPGRGDITPAQPMRKGLPPLKRVRFTGDGRMQAIHKDAIEASTRPVTLPTHPVKDNAQWRRDDAGFIGKHLTNRTIHLIADAPERFILSTTVRFTLGDRAGVVVRAGHDGHTGCYVVADRRFGRIEFGVLDDPLFIDARTWPLGDAVHLRVVLYECAVEVYADDVLVIHQVRYRETGSAIGLIVDRAEAHFTHPQLLTAT